MTLSDLVPMIIAFTLLVVTLPVVMSVVQTISEQQIQQSPATTAEWNATTEVLVNPLSEMTKTMQPFFLPLLIGVGIMMFLMIYPFGRGGSDTYTQTESSILTTLQQQQPITDISVQETGQSSYPNPFTEEQQQLPENHYHNRFEAILDDEEALEK